MTKIIVSTTPKGVTTTRLTHFPISFFAVVMGLTGFAIALEKGADTLGLPFWPASVTLGVAATVYAVLLFLYILKLFRYPEDVVAEFTHPVKVSFFPTISISLLLFSIALLSTAPEVSRYLWYAGAITQLLFTLAILNSWIRGDQYNIKHLNPAWFIPVVGNIIVPISGVTHASPEISWFFFSVGSLFWIVILTTFFYRIIFHHPLPERLVPTLAILIAPPAVGAIALAKLTTSCATLGVTQLYGLAVFFFLLVVTQCDKFLRLRFYLSWWAYSFPLAAFTIATIMLAAAKNSTILLIAAKLLLASLTLIILLLTAKTLRAVSRHEICLTEE